MMSAPPPGPNGTIMRTFRCGQSSACAARAPANAAAATAMRLRRVSMSDGAARAVRSPPPCGEGLGVGVVRYFAVGAIVISPHYPPPHPFPTRGEGADLACCSRLLSNIRRSNDITRTIFVAQRPILVNVGVYAAACMASMFGENSLTLQ